MTPEVIQAIFGGIVMVIGAVSAWQQKKMNELTKRVTELEAQVADERGKFRAAVRVIRALQRFIDELILMMRRESHEPPTNPVVIPPELEDEI